MKLFSLFLIGLFTISSCSAVKRVYPKIEAKKAPQYQGVDEHLRSYVKDYLKLSRQNHITFDKTVTVGFTDLSYTQDTKKKSSAVIIGLCTWGDNWREIDIDPQFWNNNNESRKRALIYHELTHCYCGREHDYGKDKPYPEGDASQMFLDIMTHVFKKIPSGYFNIPLAPEICPVSVMYPIVTSTYCWNQHKDHYLKEMFDRCVPW